MLLTEVFIIVNIWITIKCFLVIRFVCSFGRIMLQAVGFHCIRIWTIDSHSRITHKTDLQALTLFNFKHIWKMSHTLRNDAALKHWCSIGWICIKREYLDINLCKNAQWESAQYWYNDASMMHTLQNDAAFLISYRHGYKKLVWCNGGKYSDNLFQWSSRDQVFLTIKSESLLNCIL